MASVYLAGPDVFFPDAVSIGRAKKAICAHYGLEGRFPLDVAPAGPVTAKADMALAIFDLCKEMMTSCDLMVANLTPFRGVSMDPGTAVEMGYMHALGKPIFGYTNVAESYAERVAARLQIRPGEMVEDFEMAENLMCEGPVMRSGSSVVRRSVTDSEIFTSLEAFEVCVARASTVVLADPDG